jgi:hypothetical protein
MRCSNVAGLVVVGVLALAACTPRSAAVERTPATEASGVGEVQSAAPAVSPAPTAAPGVSAAPTAAPGAAEGRSGGSDGPPDLVITSDAGTFQRRPYTYCWSGRNASVCADGLPTDDDRIDVRGDVHLDFPVDRWTLEASLWDSVERADGPSLELAPTGDRRWTLSEMLPAGRHVLAISGRGPGGDAYWAIPVTVVDARADGNG